MDEKSFDDILSDFGKNKTEPTRLTANITVPVSDPYKDKYKEIQELSEGYFCETLRKAVMLTIDKAYSKLKNI